MKTLLQTITDTLEAAGVRVVAIETYPPDSGTVSVSLTVQADQRAESRDSDLENRLAAPGSGLGGCHDCPGGPQCDDCPTSPENSTPVKLYTPLEAVDAMMQGKVLRDEKGNEFFWENRGSQGVGFWFRDENDDTFPVRDFRGLYIGTAHA
jgi:hypothetical protein